MKEDKDVPGLPLEIWQIIFAWVLFSDLDKIGRNYFAIARLNKGFRDGVYNQGFWLPVIRATPICFAIDADAMTAQMGVGLIKLRRVMNFKLDPERNLPDDEESKLATMNFAQQTVLLLQEMTRNFPDKSTMQLAIALSRLELCQKIMGVFTNRYAWDSELAALYDGCLANLTLSIKCGSKKMRYLANLTEIYYTYIILFKMSSGIDFNLTPLRECFADVQKRLLAFYRTPSRNRYTWMIIFDNFLDNPDLQKRLDALISLQVVNGDNGEIDFIIMFLAGLFVRDSRNALVFLGKINFDKLILVLKLMYRAVNNLHGYIGSFCERMVCRVTINPLVIAHIIENQNAIDAMMLIECLDNSHYNYFAQCNVTTLIQRQEYIDHTLRELHNWVRPIESEYLRSATILPIWSCLLAQNLDHETRIGALTIDTRGDVLTSVSCCMSERLDVIFNELKNLIDVQDAKSFHFLMLDVFAVFVNYVLEMTGEISIWGFMTQRPLFGIISILLFTTFSDLLTPENRTDIFARLLTLSDEEIENVLNVLVTSLIELRKISSNQLLTVIHNPPRYSWKLINQQRSFMKDLKKCLRVIDDTSELPNFADYWEMLLASRFNNYALCFVQGLLNTETQDPIHVLHNIAEILRCSVSLENRLVQQIEHAITPSLFAGMIEYEEKFHECLRCLLKRNFTNADARCKALEWFIGCSAVIIDLLHEPVTSDLVVALFFKHYDEAMEKNEGDWFGSQGGFKENVPLEDFKLIFKKAIAELKTVSSQPPASQESCRIF
ncbi:MAG: hypothetical protein M3R00_00350 [Pseudomonadota bacterium]|nr:hypothetical protein [Pseudomonadota bacterium]